MSVSRALLSSALSSQGERAENAQSATHPSAARNCSKKVKGNAKVKGANLSFATSFHPPLDGTIATSDFVKFRVPTKKNGTRPGTGKLVIVANKSTKPKLKDKDVFTFVCNPRPAGESCPSGIANP